MKSNSDLKYFSVLSDLLLKSIRNQQTNISKTLSDFFYSAFRQIRDQNKDKPVVYPVAYYEIVYKAIEELAILKEKRNYLLEQRTSGEIWLLGELQGSEISEETYAWMWRNLLLSIQYKQDDLVMNHWTTCHQYFTYNLSYIHNEYDITLEKLQVSNQAAVEKRLAERKRFIEFHYALGGLLMYRGRYSCIKRMFNHTHCEPPKYELLPESMHEIFKFYSDLRDPYELNYSWISRRYPFPETSGINSDSVTKKWIMSYMAVLFLRQYTIVPCFITTKPLDFPTIPNTQGEIKQWIEGLDFFRNLVSEHLQNIVFLKTLNLDFITEEWCDKNHKPYPLTFIDNFKLNLELAYKTNAETLPIFSVKVSEFENSTKEIIESTIVELKKISNSKEIEDSDTDTWYVNGQKMLQSKDAFSQNPEAHHVDYDSVLATFLSINIKEGVSSTFLFKKSKSYLLKPIDIFNAIDRLNIDEQFVIVCFGVNLGYYIDNLKIHSLETGKFKNTQILNFGSTRQVNESFFILRRDDLPQITTKEISPEIIKKYSLNKISDNIELYSSIIDLNNTSQEIIEENIKEKEENEVRQSVLLSIIISTEIKWKKGIEMIQINEYSEYSHNGIPNSINEIKPTNRYKPN